MLLISDAIFGEVGLDKAMVLIGTIHDPLKHVQVSLFLVSIRDYSRDSVLKFDQGLSLPPKGY